MASNILTTISSSHLHLCLLSEKPMQLRFSHLLLLVLMLTHRLAWNPVNVTPHSPLFSPRNPTYGFHSHPITITLPLLPPKECKKLVVSYSPPLRVQIPTPNNIHSPLTGSTRTITTLVGLALSLPKHFASKIFLLSLEFLPALPNPNTLAIQPSTLFFAVISDNSRLMSTGTPMTVIPAALAKWLEIYNCVLLIRVLLSWFPNMPWDQQPMSAIRDLCDPYLNLFRGIIPPLFNSLDVSPILAFLLLGMLGQLLRPTRLF